MKVSKIWHEEDEIYACVDTEFSERVGTYGTEERALEVLEEIQRHLVVINDRDSNLFYVYEMPKE